MKIICIGRNYAAHAEELHHQTGLAATGDEPLWFLKPDTALLRNNDPFYVPDFSQEVHYECELVVRIDRVGKCIEERFAHRYYREVGLGIDFTARDVQREAIRQGLPWERAKAFDRSAALSPHFIPLEELGGDVQRLRFELELNGRVCQRGDTSLMLRTVDRLIACVSRYMTLKMGDLLYTGTPAGVGPVHPGDTLRATLEERELLNFDIR
ncbi:fumarylacetoacetate hydrolase family protein [uncultured Alistipes sp.]|uniref:fumarylacetoacetate hydrolase family protein n=1 Tax=uncultured Alistipes sp. TaxID=538949 RepID=UPI00265E1489|nr:fumarylacetoacetate hydrolase family protein [uncultured Alistipes sp.]